VNLQAKTVGASERDEGARLDPRRLVFVDECGANIGLVPPNNLVVVSFSSPPADSSKRRSLLLEGDFERSGFGTSTRGLALGGTEDIWYSVSQLPELTSVA
jgi:hypothetical protein